MRNTATPKKQPRQSTDVEESERKWKKLNLKSPTNHSAQPQPTFGKNKWEIKLYVEVE